MKQLVVMRHGEAGRHAGVSGDHDRPIDHRGVASSRSMGRVLDRAGLVPDRVLASSALRARTTAELVVEAAGWDVPVDVTDGFYEASVDDVLARLSLLPDEVDRLLVVGHQPTWGALVWRLTGGAVAMRTATVVVVELALGRSWNPEGLGGELTGELEAVLQPRHFPPEDP